MHNGSCDPPPSSGKGGVKTNLGIIKTNSFTVSRGPRSLLVLFPDVARINHSCAPNCHHYWSKKSGEFVIRAVRNLAEGEELSISYMSPLQRADFHDRDARRRILKVLWNELPFAVDLGLHFSHRFSLSLIICYGIKCLSLVS